MKLPTLILGTFLKLALLAILQPIPPLVLRPIVIGLHALQSGQQTDPDEGFSVGLIFQGG